jgi:hypothetical protein
MPFGEGGVGGVVVGIGIGGGDYWLFLSFFLSSCSLTSFTLSFTLFCLLELAARA